MPPPSAGRDRARAPGFGSRRLRVALAAGMALLILVVATAFDATWLRPLVQRYVRQHAGRQIDFDRMQWRLDDALQPVLRMRNLALENAPWAKSSQPLIKASAVDITIAWKSIRGDGLVIPLLAVVDADIDLERQADGLRNWRIADPQDRGPGRVRLLALQAQRSRIHFVHLGQDFELELATTPLPAPKPLASRPELTLAQVLHLEGRHHAVRFQGDIDVADVLTLRDTGRDFGLSGRLQSGDSTLTATGVARDFLQLAGLDLDAHVSSPDLGQSAAALLGLQSWPNLAADATGRLRKDAVQWTVSDLHAKVGHSDVAGMFSVTPRSAGAGSKPTLRAALAGERLDLNDLRQPMAGRRTQSVASAVRESAANHGAARRLDDFDAEVDLKLAKLDGLPLATRLGPMSGLHTHASLRAGHLLLTPVDFTLAGGEATGRATVDATQYPAAAAVDFRFARLRLADLIQPRSGAARVEGRLNLHLNLQSRGDSFAAWRDALGGDVSAELLQATLPATLDARLALDAGQWLRAVVAGPDKRVAVTCSIGQMHFDGGRGRTTRLAIETENVVLSGTASADLRQKSFDLLLTPHRKQSALLGLDKSVRLQARVGQPKVVALVDRDEANGTSGCSQPARR